MTFKQAEATLKKYRKWNSGELDSWDKHNRVPPTTTMRSMYDALAQAVHICNELNLIPEDVDDSMSRLVSVTPGCKVIQITAPGVDFPFINTGKWILNKPKKGRAHARKTH